MVYFLFAVIIIGGVFAFLQFTTFGMVVRAGMADRETVGLLGINIDRASPSCSASPPRRGPCRCDVHPDQLAELPHGHGLPRAQSSLWLLSAAWAPLPGAVLAGFVLGILESFASMREVNRLIPGINQIIIYLVAIIILLTRPRGLMGRKGVMED